MPGQTVRSAAKNQSKSSRAKDAKNARRVEAACNGDLCDCTYGRVIKTLGDKMFNILDVDKREHLAHIRGKMARINVSDVVLLNKREYESRSDTVDAVYDIMAVFAKKDIGRLVRSNLIPRWLASAKTEGAEGDEAQDLFDFEESDSDSDDEDGDTKKGKKSHRKAGKNAIIESSDSDATPAAEVDIDAI